MLRNGARIRAFGISGISVLGLSLLATVGAAGCTPQDLEEFFGDVKNAPTQPAGTAVPFQIFSDDVSAVSAKETRALIRTAQGYVSFFGHAPPAGVDFSTDWVIFYAAGTKPTGGYDVSIASLTRAGSELVAVTSLVSPGPNCIEPQIVTTPNVLIKLAAQTGASIQFFKNDSVNNCGTDNPCAAVLCPVGTTCVVEAVVCVAAPCPPRGVCVPVTPPQSCGGFVGAQCPGSGQCVDDPSDSCDPNHGGADCPGICKCLPTPCPSNAPFNPDPSVCACVPKGPVVHCGGIAGIQCPGGGHCVDDPSDSCDPKNGGADCGGICQCVETVSCIIGDIFDSSPGVCMCVPKATPPTCPPVCDIFCTYGNVMDANGCPTCSCKPAPTP
jgi:hypothetical protein